MQDSIGKKIPACFSSSTEKKPSTDHNHNHHHHQHGSLTRSGQSLHTSVYRTKVAGRSRLITITWSKNMLLLHHGLSISLSGPEGGESQLYSFNVELKPWQFWKKKHGSSSSKSFAVDGGDGGGGNKNVTIFWDIKSAKFNNGESTEPASDYYVAVVCDREIVLLIGDLKKDAYKRIGCRPASIEPVLVSKTEHVFGKRKFSVRAKFHERGRSHEISIECKNGGGPHQQQQQPEMEMRFDGKMVIHVKQLQWKFRGNETVRFEKMRVEVYWDVHDWLFSPGLKHALFIFKPVFLSSMSSSLSSSCSPPLSLSSSSTPLSNHTGVSSSGSGSVVEGLSSVVGGSSSLSEFCLFIYAWKIE